MSIKSSIFIVFLLAQSVSSVFATDVVVLLHGIGRSSQSMVPLATALQNHDYKVINIDYPSRKYSIEQLANIVNASIQPAINSDDDKLYFVTHSMGGLVARAWITQYKPTNVAGVVMLGPPNQGSEVADFFQNNFLYKWLYGPAGQQLGTKQSAALNQQLGLVSYPLGVIAGNRTIDPISWLIIPGQNDGKVAVERTKLSGMSAYIVMPTTHAFMMKNTAVMDEVIYFLQHGKFNQEDQNQLLGHKVDRPVVISQPDRKMVIEQ